MDDIATFRNLQLSRFFAETSIEATQRGELSTQEMVKNATSVHIITVITLVFLPATFVTVRAFCHRGKLVFAFADIIVRLSCKAVSFSGRDPSFKIDHGYLETQFSSYF